MPPPTALFLPVSYTHLDVYKRQIVLVADVPRFVLFYNTVLRSRYNVGVFRRPKEHKITN